MLWLSLESIPGTETAMRSLKKLGKQVVFVSNNCTKSLDDYIKQLKKGGFDIEKDHLVTPALATVSYLKKQNFNKEIFVIGMSCLKQDFKNAGLKIAQDAVQF